MVDSCLYIRTDDPGMPETWLPILPRAGVTWDGETLVVAGRSYHVGDHVAMTGWLIHEPEETAALPNAIIPASCKNYPRVVVAHVDPTRTPG